MNTLFQQTDVKYDRILVIDDNPAIHEDIKKILSPPPDNEAKLQNAEYLLFGDMVSLPLQNRFHMDSAFQGEEGLAHVQQACREDNPYALAIVDIRMPPGWDGLETINQIWSVDPDIQIIICTAYSDYSWDDMIQNLDKTDKMVILKKPFENIELMQLTFALTQKWALQRQVNAHIKRQDERIQEKEYTLRVANTQLKSEINERYRTQDALEASEERFALAFQASPVPLAIMKLEGLVWIDVNVSFLEMTGLDSEMVLGKSCFEIPIWPSTSALADLLHQVHEHTSLHNWDFQLKRVDDTFRDTKISMRIFYLDNAPHALLLFQDITNQITLENQLRQSQKMDAIGQLTAGIAHDFNNMLTVIQGHVSMMLNRSEWSPDYEEGLNHILDAARKAANLTHNLLAFNRQQIIQPQVLNINQVVRKLSQMLDRLIGEQIHCHYYYAPDLPRIYADRTCLEQILINLALNARDAMIRGGTLIISTSVVTINESYLARVHDARPGRYVCLNVVDTGHGIDPKILDRIWDPFFTTKDIGKGTGMGLSMVYGLVKQHKGWITVSSQPDQGTTFEIYLPQTDQPLIKNKQAIEAESFSVKTFSGGQTILVVEDDDAVRQFAEITMRTMGFHVIAASDAVEATRLWQDHNKEIDLLFTDIILPNGITGINLAERLIAQKPDLRILITSGYNMAQLHMEQIQHRILPKPYMVDDLSAALQKCLQAAGGKNDMDT